MKPKMRSKWDSKKDCKAGLRTYNLAQEFKYARPPRLKVGTIETLKKDLDTLARAGEQTAAKAPKDVLKTANVGGASRESGVALVIASLSIILSAYDCLPGTFASSAVLPSDMEGGKRPSHTSPPPTSTRRHARP